MNLKKWILVLWFVLFLLLGILCSWAQSEVVPACFWRTYHVNGRQYVWMEWCCNPCGTNGHDYVYTFQVARDPSFKSLYMSVSSRTAYDTNCAAEFVPRDCQNQTCHSCDAWA